MADGFKTLFNGGLNLKPQSSDPSNPAEGDIFRSDGTSRTVGLWQYVSGTWQQIASTDNSLSISSKSSAYTLTTSDDVILADTSSGAFTLTLPAAASSTGKVFKFIKTDTSTNLLTIDANSTETIEGETTLAFAGEFNKFEIVSDGTEWKILECFSVSARYTSNAGQNNSSGAFTIIKYEDLVYDNCNIYNTSTGQATVPVTGKYNISAKAALASVTADTGDIAIAVYKNGAEIDRVFTAIQRGTIHSKQISTDVELAKGDTCSIYIYHTNGSGRALISTAVYNVMSIHRIK